MFCRRCDRIFGQTGNFRLHLFIMLPQYNCMTDFCPVCRFLALRFIDPDECIKAEKLGATVLFYKLPTRRVKEIHEQQEHQREERERFNATWEHRLHE